MGAEEVKVRFTGYVIDRNTGNGIPNLDIVLHDDQRKPLESGQTGAGGEFGLEISSGRFGTLRDGQPHLIVRVTRITSNGRTREGLYDGHIDWERKADDEFYGTVNAEWPTNTSLTNAVKSVADKLPDPNNAWPIVQQAVGALENIATKTPDQQARQQEQDGILKALNDLATKTSDRQERKQDRELVVEALDDIAAYMPTGIESNGSGGHPTGGGSNGDLQGVVERELVAVLGGRWKTTEDAKPEGKSVLASLARSFPAEQTNGSVTYRFRPRAYAIHTELGGSVTGAQASLYRRAKAALDDALPLLDALEPQESSGADDEDVEATRQIVRTELGELVNELGREGGPRVQRVDGIFTLLQKHFGNPAKPKKLGKLGKVFGLNRKRVTTIEEEQNFTNYLIIRDYVRGLASAWAARDRAQFLVGSGLKPFLGTQFYLLESTLTTAAEQVEETYRAMDAVGLGPAERRTVMIALNGQFPPMTVDELLSWVAQVTTDEWPQLIREGGRDGVRALTPTAETLRQLVEAAAKGDPTDLGHVGLTRERVRRKLRELATQLARINDLAQAL